MLLSCVIVIKLLTLFFFVSSDGGDKWIIFYLENYKYLSPKNHIYFLSNFKIKYFLLHVPELSFPKCILRLKYSSSNFFLFSLVFFVSQSGLHKYVCVSVWLTYTALFKLSSFASTQTMSRVRFYTMW